MRKREVKGGKNINKKKEEKKLCIVGYICVKLM